ncbi:cytochrome p450 [Trifolium pratense]|uniref:Cytochrome p450 n=1 Tax=Trifolium pratense TaxID=57577 RepID=A0A2K3MQD3_TRIPR|nr:cytochrome p450 [Trifolium pratense]
MMITSTGRGEEGTTQEDWNCIWKVHDPPKTKHLLWRICKGCLPTRNRLKDSCLVSTQARQSAGLDHVVTSWIQHVGTAKELLLTICQAESREVAGKLAMLLWVLWKNRNNSVWEDIKESGQVLGAKAMHLWQEWKAVQCTTSNKNTQPELQQQHTQWQRPQFGWFKCNVDAGFHNDSCKTSGGRL